MPVVFSLILIVGFVLPSFLLFEPHESDETISLKLAAIVCIAVFGLSTVVFRIFASWWRTRRLSADWLRNSEPIEISSISIPAFRLRHDFPVFAVVGVVRPRLFIAENVLEVLDQNEVEAVVQHELGHISARDNLKRLLLKLTGDLLVVRVGSSLERYWAAFAEAAADEYAVETGGRGTALSLASALIKIARLLPVGAQPPIPSASYVIGAGDSLSVRIKRLLRLAESKDIGSRSVIPFWAPAVFALFPILIMLATDQKFLSRIHNISEAVIALLQ
jgi:hypothetical protein